jgi:hypothetical protein
MPTAKQTAASRMNSQKSTGPRTTQGKAASRFNALKHGIFATAQIMFDESAEDLAELAAEYHEHHNPADTDQRLLVDTLIHNEWRLRRMRRVEAVLWEQAANIFFTQHPESQACNAADAFTTNVGYFERLQRMVNGCERNYHRALKELQRQKSKVLANVPPANPDAPPQPPQPEQSTTTSTSSASFHTNPKTPPPAAPQSPVAAPDATPFADPAAPASSAEPQPGSSDGFPIPSDAV